MTPKNEESKSGLKFHASVTCYLAVFYLKMLNFYVLYCSIFGNYLVIATCKLIDDDSANRNKGFLKLETLYIL